MQLSLSTITQELAYERSLRAIECVTKDEDIRKLRFQIMLLEDENNDLHEQLEHEQERGDNLDHEIEDVLAREGELEERLAQNAGELRMKEREIEILKVRISCRVIRAPQFNSFSRPNSTLSKQCLATGRSF